VALMGKGGSRAALGGRGGGEGVGSWCRGERRWRADSCATATVPMQPVRSVFYCLLLTLRWMRAIDASKK
jgi:hypothetical protein